MAFGNFSLTDLYTDFITKINTQLRSAASMFRNQMYGDFNYQIRYDSNNKRFQQWNGISSPEPVKNAWVDLDLTAVNAGRIGGNLPSAFATAAQGAKADTYTAADVLTKLLTVDGTTSGLDADLLDGQHGSYYAPASTAVTDSTYSADFATTLADTGAQSVKGGLKLKWGTTTAHATGAQSVTFSAAFPAACLHVFLTPVSTGGAYGSAGVTSMTTSGCVLNVTAPLYSTASFHWLAIGY